MWEIVEKSLFKNLELWGKTENQCTIIITPKSKNHWAFTFSFSISVIFKALFWPSSSICLFLPFFLLFAPTLPLHFLIIIRWVLLSLLWLWFRSLNTSKNLSVFIFFFFVPIMGSCFSTSIVSGSKSNANTTTTATNHNSKPIVRPPSRTTKVVGNRQEASENQRHNKRNETTHKNTRNSQQLKRKEKNTRRQRRTIPCGTRTDFGYTKDFDRCYSIGKLLGHGQFGYTFVATDKANGDRVAVKRIEKKKVEISFNFWIRFCSFGFFSSSRYGDLCGFCFLFYESVSVMPSFLRLLLVLIN